MKLKFGTTDSIKYLKLGNSYLQFERCYQKEVLVLLSLIRGQIFATCVLTNCVCVIAKAIGDAFFIIVIELNFPNCFVYHGQLRFSCFCFLSCNLQSDLCFNWYFRYYYHKLISPFPAALGMLRIQWLSYITWIYLYVIQSLFPSCLLKS